MPDSGDVKSQLYAPNLTVSDSGDAYLGLDILGSRRFLHFAPDGKRVGIDESKLDEIAEKWFAQPGTSRRWVLGYQRVLLVDEKGAVVRTITRRADGFWLVYPEAAATAPDGSIAIVSSTDVFRPEKREPAVSIYSPRGNPILSFKLPQTVEWSHPAIAYDGTHVVLIGARAIVLASASGKLLGQFVPAHSEQAAWTPFLAPTAAACSSSTAKKPSTNSSCREAI